MRKFRAAAALLVAMWMIVLSPAAVLADEVAGSDTGAVAETGAGETGPGECTGAGCGQGTGQGEGQGGVGLEDLGATQNEAGEWVLPEGVEDSRQGAQQGTGQGTAAGISAENSGTGADSTNNNSVNSAQTSQTSVNNSALDTTLGAAAANTGSNTQNKNTGSGATVTGNANIGVTQLKNDNTTLMGGTAALDVSGHSGNWNGDYTIGAGSGAMDISGGQSVRAVNETTGADSTNGNEINTRREEIAEVQNDGRINNILDLLAKTGQNQTSRNTGDGSITTGDANVAATLVNLLNTTVIDGSLWIMVRDIFGDLNGNIVLPELEALAAAAAASGLKVDAANTGTGGDLNNKIKVAVSEREETLINNDADVTTKVTAEAISGQNTTDRNTGGAIIETGQADVSASNVTLANTTVEGGNWGLVIVNALNKWMGFLVGDNGQVKALSQEETIREIEAQNSNTGADSNNEITVRDETEKTTRVDNDAVINNDITARAITGRNEANENTGSARVMTGDANVEATAVNIANTTVKNATLFIAVVNVFGDWFGDLVHNGSALANNSSGPAHAVEVEAANTDTGAGSDNTIEVDVEKEKATVVNNRADVTTILDAIVDTGGNRARANTGGAEVKTGTASLSLHSRTAANLVGISEVAGTSLAVTGLNGNTGAESENRIKARLNETRVVEVNNDATVDTILPALINTGNNEASYNTLGALIETGDALAAVAISNLLNQVIAALGGDMEVLADLANLGTGYDSDNKNDIKAWRELLTGINNRGLVNNLIDLLLNTGRNTANKNTGGGDIVSGAACVDGVLVNDVNAAVVRGGSADINQFGEVNNQAGVRAVTGQNGTDYNTGQGLGGGKSGDCNKIALADDDEGDEEKEELVKEVKEEDMGEVGMDGAGGDGGEEKEVATSGRVAGKQDSGPSLPRIGNGKQELKRFPVAGEFGRAAWLSGKRKNTGMWQAYLLVSAGVLAAAWHFDQRARRQLIVPLAS